MVSENLSRNERSRTTRHENIVAAKVISEIIRTSLGPKGMDKMIEKGEVIITNDGATILREMAVVHPCAKMLVELSKAQDVEVGDGTSSVVVLAGSLLGAAETLLDKGIHPQLISQYFMEGCNMIEKILRSMSIKVDLTDKNTLIKSACTSLSSKVVSHSAQHLASIAVDAVLGISRTFQKNSIVSDYENAMQDMKKTVDLKSIRIVKKLGGTVEDTELVDGLILHQQKVSRTAGGPTRIQNARIGLIQFCLSAPKTDIENNIVVKDYTAMDRLLREERLLIAKMIKQIAATGCNVLLIQKSILREAISTLALDYCAKAKILVVKDIERDEIEFLSKALNCSPIASLDHFTSDKLGTASSVSDEDLDGNGRICRITGIPGKDMMTIFVRASNSLMLDETERCIHDALCVVRSIIKEQALVPGGGACESQIYTELSNWAKSLSGVKQMCIRAYAQAFEIIPYTLAENAGLNPIEIVTQLRKKHFDGEIYAGINVRKAAVTDILKENVLQPLLVNLSSVKLATETVMMILKIDDIIPCY
ncbi:T-complex 1 delta subunit [Cryptosporidium sp. chipmunk genotype I]|uniref:T-complex 1 delta subunit n=1 Tax=Cryptosporidium sp. chipmunk genotype I TaxID=1280935 RepID=UPI00351A1273|nr:T-complex 1 delta subunit [Cryptosporidium sp. chipmunk genotype I]